MKKVCVVTGTRAEFGLLSNLISKIQSDDYFCLQIIVTGMHLSPEFGNTYNEIIDRGFKIDKKIEIILSSDTSIGVSKSMGLAQISFAEAFKELDPDLIIILGDRYEILSVATTAMIMRIPIAHINGGELTEGAIDDSIRHAITKMSQLHLVGTDEYRQRVIQLGEEPERVFNTGDLCIDGIIGNKLMSKDEFEQSIDFRLGEKNLLLTYHPETLSYKSSKEQFEAVLEAISKISDVKIIITHPNSDTEGREIISMINDYVNSNNNTIAFSSLGYIRYLSALQFMDAVIGNSSSGVTEVPFFGIPTVNIGKRQQGRIKADSVIDCECLAKDIHSAILNAFSDDFIQKAKKSKNPYGDGKASERMLSILKSINLEEIRTKKFYDI